MTDITLPTPGSDPDSWGTILNNALQALATEQDALKGLSVAIGSVTSGDTASATISGVSPNFTLDLVLQKGDPGTGSVSTVNGNPGPNVVLAASDVGAIASGLLGAVNGVATLGANGQIPTSQIPAVAYGTVFPVASQAAMLALSSATGGDVAARTDGAGSFMLKRSGNPATLADWVLLSAPTDAVVSVNGQTGTVNLSAANVSALGVANNLSDLTNASSARTNLGLGTAAVAATGTASGNVPVLNASGQLAAGVVAPNIIRVLYNTGSSSYPARPTGAAYVEWIGPTAPTGAISGDTYVATS